MVYCLCFSSLSFLSSYFRMGYLFFFSFYLALLQQYYSIIRLWQLYCLINLTKKAGWGGARERSKRRWIGP